MDAANVHVIKTVYRLICKFLFVIVYKNSVAFTLKVLIKIADVTVKNIFVTFIIRLNSF